MLNKKMISILIIGLMVFNGLTFAAPSHWAKDSYYSLKYEGIINEAMTTENSFQKDILREEFIEILMKVYLDEKRINIASFRPTNYFVDTNNPYIEYAYSLNIVSGVGENRFAPDAKVTRQEMVVMLKNILDALGLTKSVKYQSDFTDRSKMAPWALEAIDYCSSQNIINGMGDGRFAPLANATREQAFKLVDNLYSAFGLKDEFNREVPNQRKGNFLVYQNGTTNLQVYEKDERMIILSKGFVDFGEVLNIKADHYQIYRILESNESIGFKTIDELLSDINGLYDPVRQRYGSDEILYDLKTGRSNRIINGPSIQLKSDNHLEIRVKLY
jgi:hypothetical protein